MNDTNYWNTPLSKLKEDYPDYQFNIRLLLANACSYAEKNLRACDFKLFNGDNDNSLGINEYNEIKAKLKGLKPYDLKYFKKYLHILRGIHNFSYHYTFDKKICLNKKYISYKKLLDYTEYQVAVDIDEDFAEITFFGAMVIIGQFLTIREATAVAQDFKQFFITYKNPIFLDCKDKPSAERQLKQLLFRCCRTSPALVNVEGEVKRSGFDTNSLIRRFTGILFDAIEKAVDYTTNFKESLASLNINDFELVDKIICLRNWYCHGGNIFEWQRNYRMTPAFLIEVIYDLFKCDISDDIKEVIKHIANEELISAFDMVAKYSIKLTDNDIIINGIKNKKYDWLSHRITNIGYHDPYRTGFYTDKDFLRLLEIVDNTYSSRYNDSNEFNGLRRNFSTNHIQFVTLKSKHLKVYKEYANVEEFTIINPLLFTFNTNDEIHYTTINDMNLCDILPNECNERISHITIDLDAITPKTKEEVTTE